MDEDPAKECTINLDLLERAVTAVETLSTNFKFIVLPTGTKVISSHPQDSNPSKLTNSTDIRSPPHRQIPIHTTPRRVAP